MKRIGILGTENSHAYAFTELINRPKEDGNYRFPNVRVTALYALEKAPSEKIRDEIDSSITIVDTVDEMIPLVDCVIVTARHGKYHKPFAEKFIERGMPVFIDKPFTISAQDARDLVELAKAHNVPLCGGSGCKYSLDIESLRDELKSLPKGEIYGAAMNFPAQMDSEYGGFYFYAPHLCEMVTAVFGADYKSVTAMENGGNLNVLLGYEKFNVTMNFMRNHEYIAIVYCENGNIVKEIKIENIYLYELEKYIEMIETGKMPCGYNALLQPVLMLNAIEKSLVEKRMVEIEEI